MKHLRLANGSATGLAGARRDSSVSEICLVDYSHCPQSDLCWLIDAGCGCQERDNCIVDTG